jgi:hypothetical protein
MDQPIDSQPSSPPSASSAVTGRRSSSERRLLGQTAPTTSQQFVQLPAPGAGQRRRSSSAGAASFASMLPVPSGRGLIYLAEDSPTLQGRGGLRRPSGDMTAVQLPQRLHTEGSSTFVSNTTTSSSRRQSGTQRTSMASIPSSAYLAPRTPEESPSRRLRGSPPPAPLEVDHITQVTSSVTTPYTPYDAPGSFDLGSAGGRLSSAGPSPRHASPTRVDSCSDASGARITHIANELLNRHIPVGVDVEAFKPNGSVNMRAATFVLNACNDATLSRIHDTLRTLSTHVVPGASNATSESSPGSPTGTALERRSLRKMPPPRSPRQVTFGTFDADNVAPVESTITSPMAASPDSSTSVRLTMAWDQDPAPRADTAMQ